MNTTTSATESTKLFTVEQLERLFWEAVDIYEDHLPESEDEILTALTCGFEKWVATEESK